MPLRGIPGRQVFAKGRARLLHSFRALTLRNTPIAEAGDAGPIRIDGMALAREEDEALLVSPCEGDPAVWFRLRVRRCIGGVGGDGGGSLWVSVLDESEMLPFDVMDRTAARAKVVPNGARISAKPRTYVFRVTSSPFAAQNTLSPEGQMRVGEILLRRGVDAWPGDVYEEWCIRPGDRVTVVGFARRSGVSVATAYRETVSPRLVVEGSAQCPLFIARSAPRPSGADSTLWSRLRLFWRSLG